MTAWGGRRAQQLRAQVLQQYGTVCHLCGKDGADTADHVTPRALGGTDTLDNLRPAHAACNFARQDTPLGLWFRSHPLPPMPPLPPSRDW